MICNVQIQTVTNAALGNVQSAKIITIEMGICVINVHLRVPNVHGIISVLNASLTTSAPAVSLIALAVKTSFVLKTMVCVRQTAMLVIIRKHTMCAQSVGRHAKNATIMIIVLSALKEHIFNQDMQISIV